MENILEKINKAGLKLLESMTAEQTYNTIVTEAINLVEAESGSVFLEKNDSLERVYASNNQLFNTRIRKRGHVFTTFRDGKPSVIEINQIEKIHPGLKKLGIQSTILVPLSYHSESIGVLTLHSGKKEHFTHKELDMLKLFGSMASLAIKKSQQYSETRKALEIRDMFISMAAHELRTPITSISGYIQLLHAKLANREGVEGKWIRELYGENKRLMSLVKEILEVNRLKTGQLQFIWQECDLVTLVTEAVNEVRQSYPDREIQFENKMKGEAQIVGDGSKLIQVFNNIIDNGIKYSQKTMPVSVTLGEKGGFYIITVKDWGKGIDKKDLPYIFEGHHKGEGGEEGMGIGLFFVESVVRQHKAVINVKSKVKKGTTVEIRLPKSKI